MAKNKLKKFAELESFSHVIQPSLEELNTQFKFKGRWNKDLFKNDGPIVLELGCGKGEYSVALAQEYPRKFM